MKDRIFINNLIYRQLAKQDTILNTIPPSTVFNDSSWVHQIDTSLIKSDSIALIPINTGVPNRFITEKDVIKNLPESTTLSLVPEWITFLVFGAFILLAILNFLHRKNLLQIFRATLGSKQTLQLIRDGNPLRKRFMPILSLIYLIAIPLLFYSIIESYSKIKLGILSEANLYFVLFFLLIGFFIYKVVFIKLMAILFQTQKASFELLINIIIFNQVLGIIILPFITLFIYTQLIIFLQISIAIYVIGIVLRLFREIQVGMSQSIFSILHLFLYLCTLEFIPIVIIGKLIINNYIK